MEDIETDRIDNWIGESQSLSNNIDRFRGRM